MPLKICKSFSIEVFFLQTCSLGLLRVINPFNSWFCSNWIFKEALSGLARMIEAWTLPAVQTATRQFSGLNRKCHKNHSISLSFSLSGLVKTRKWAFHFVSICTILSIEPIFKSKSYLSVNFHSSFLAISCSIFSEIQMEFPELKSDSFFF